MKKLLLLLLLVPILSIAQKKKELKERITQKNDSLTLFISQIDDLFTNIDSLEKENTEFEGDIKKLLQKVSDEKEKNRNFSNEINTINTNVIDLENNLLKLRIDKSKVIDSLSKFLDEIKNNNEILLKDLKLTTSESKIKSDTIQELISGYVKLTEKFKSIAADCDKMKDQYIQLKNQDNSVMYLPAVFHSCENIEDAGGEYDITFSLQSDSGWDDTQSFISFGAGSDLIEGKVYMFGLTYEFSDAVRLYNFISDVRELTQEELDAGYADPSY